MPTDAFCTANSSSRRARCRACRHILEGVVKIAEELPTIFPVHPRTRGRIQALGLQSVIDDAKNLRLCDPLGYLEFLSLTSAASLILTDSGGLQEESTVLGIPCLTLRENTERPITIDEDTNVLVGTDPGRIIAEAKKALANGHHGRVPELWDGHTGERIVAVLTARLR